MRAGSGRWFDDAEIYRWFGENLHRVREPSLRHYVRARELKAAGMDWTAVLAAEDENRRARLAAELLESNAYASTAARVTALVAQGGGCRAALIATLLPDPGTPQGRKELLEKIGGKVVTEVQKKVGGKTLEVVKERTEGGVLHWGNENSPDMDWFREEIKKAYGGRTPRVTNT